MREHRIIHKPSRQMLVQQMPSQVLGTNGHFYSMSAGLNIYVDLTPMVAVDEFTGAYDLMKRKVFENDIVKVSLHAYNFWNKNADQFGWVEAVAIVVYNEEMMAWNLEVLTKEYRELPDATDWTVQEVIGNRWQNPEIIQNLRPEAAPV